RGQLDALLQSAIEGCATIRQAQRDALGL
ncbi:MAG TPA: ribonuclease PH, partial [Myxococcales bacterium]|nr:ribonuclease PH [Myxococcales bacterium]